VSRAGAAAPANARHRSRESHRCRRRSCDAHGRRTELVSKDQEVVRLRAELAEVRAAGKAASGGASAAAEESASLRRERDALRRQVADMESFLNDYGLVWVGGGEEEASQGGGKHERAYSGFDLALDFGVLAARVQELNALAGGDGAKRAVTRGGVTRLEDAEHVPVTVWRDGFMLWRGPFRAAPSAEAQSFLRDVLDGFFPSELKGAYPDGVLLRLVDRTEEAYDGSAAGPGPGVQRGAASRADKPGFAGEGRSLGGGPCAGAAADDTAAAEAKAAAAGGRPVAATRPRGGPVGLADIGDPDLDMARPMGRDEFLSRVPETVMRGGRVIKVREGLGDLMGASSAAGRPDVVIARTPAVEAIRGLEGAAGTAEAARPASAAMGATFRASPADGGAPADTSEVTTLVVRSDSGRQTLVVKLGFDDTIADLREYVDRYRAKEGDYDLVTAFPRKAYTDPAQSLRDAGLVPNAKLMIRPR